MAEAGFRTRTEKGIMQIDSNYENFALLKKIKGICRGNLLFQFGYGFLDIQVKYDYPIFVAIRGTYAGQKIFQHYVVKNNGIYTIRIIATVDTEVEVYIYSKAPVSKTNNGLNIYNGKGELAFSSDIPYLWINNIVNIIPSSATAGQVIPSLNNNPYVAVCMPPMTSFLGTSPTLNNHSPFKSFPLIYDKTYYQLVLRSENLFYINDGTPLADNYYIHGTFILVDIRNTMGMNWDIL